MAEYPMRWITDDLAVGYAPRSHDDLETIKNAGIDAIVNVCAECYDLHETEEAAGFDVLYLAVADECAPELPDLEKLVAWLDERVSSGRKVLVHCRFGIGRTGTLVAAYLLYKGSDIRTALKSMKHTPAMPISVEQWRLLRHYSDRLGYPASTIKDIESSSEDTKGTFFDKWETMLKWFTDP